jgi:hypothetical protein
MTGKKLAGSEPNYAEQLDCFDSMKELSGEPTRSGLARKFIPPFTRPETNSLNAWPVANLPLGTWQTYSFQCPCGTTETREAPFSINGKLMGVRATKCARCKRKLNNEAKVKRQRAAGVKELVVFWTAERIAHVKQLWHSGLSATAIGPVYGKSRSAILGLLGRHGILGERSKHKRTESQRRKSKHDSVKRYRAKLKSFNYARRVPSQRAPGLVASGDPSLILPAPLNHTIEQVTGCRQPYGDGPFTFCGHERREGSSYCDGHHRQNHVRP